MIDFGTVKPGSTLYVPFSSFAGSTGASITLTGLLAGDIEVYKDGGTTQRASDTGYTLLDTDGIDFDGITGIHGFSIDLSSNADAGFYASGSRYFIVVSSVTVDSQTVNFLAGRFIIGYPGSLLDTTIASLSTQTSFTLTAGPAEDDALNGLWLVVHDVASAVQQAVAVVSDYTGSTKTVTLAAAPTFTIAATDNISVMGMAPLQPTVLGRTLDVSTGGEAGIDWNNIGSPTTSQTLSGTTVGTATAVTNQVTANVTQISGDTAAADNAEAFFDGTGYAGTNNVIPTVTTLTGHTPQTGDSFARLGAPAGASVSADIAAIEAQTDDIGAAGAGLTAVPWNPAWDAEVQSEVEDALVVHRLDELLNADSDIDGAAPPTVGSVVHELLSKTAGSFTYDQTTDSLEALRDNLATASALATVQADTDDIQTRLPAALVSGRIDASVGAMAAGVVTAAAVATGAIDADALATDAVAEIADGVWDEAISGHLGAGSTGAALNAAGSAGDPWTTPLPGAYGAGTAGNIVGTNLDATVSSRASQTSVNTIDDFLDTEIAAIQADTDDIQARLPAALVSGRIDANVGALSGDATAADNAEAFFDGTGYAGTGNVIPTVTTVNGLAANTVTAAALAADAVTEIQSGLATAAALATVQADTDDIQTRLPAALVSGRIDASVGAMAANTITASATAADFITEIGTEVNAQVVDVVSVDTIPELAQAAPAATPTLFTAVMLLYMMARNLSTQDADGLNEFTNNAGTVIFKRTVTDDGTLLSRPELVTGP